MKKTVFLALTMTSLNAMAWEVNVKTGYEQLRANSFNAKVSKLNGNENKPVSGSTNISNGFVAGVEYIPFNKGLFELGLGVEAKLGKPFGENKGLGMSYEKDYELYSFPVYALGKFNLFKSEDNNYSHYVLGRFGYDPSFIKYTSNGGGQNKKADYVNAGGLYYGTGLGVDLGPVTIEAVYDGTYRNVTDKDNEVVGYIISKGISEDKLKGALGNDNGNGGGHYDIKAKSFRHSFGLRFGVKFGDYRTPKMVEEAPVVVEEVVAPVVVEEPVVLPTPTPAPKRQLIHASCDDGKCIIHGFEIDGRVPSKEEQRNIQEIVQQVNDFALSGQVAVVGHTDATGSEAYNQKLSEKRALNVVKLLQEAGLKPEIQVMSITGKGELEPMDTNKTKAGRYNNRRVEIIFEQIEQ